MIPALVLTAGFGIRLRPLSHLRAKAALPVAGVPLIERIVGWLSASGVRNLVLNLHHLPHTITAIAGDGSHLGVQIRYSWENPVLGSGGGPRKALPLLASPSFLIVNGDTLTDLDVHALQAAHGSSEALITMAVIPNRQPEKYGGVIVDDSGSVVGFRRKGEQGPCFHFIGVQMANREAFASVPDNVPVESVVGLYRELLRTTPAAVRAFVTEAEFFDIGTPQDYLQTSLRLAKREGTATIHGDGCQISPSAQVVDAVLWDGVRVEGGAKIERCVVTDGVRIPHGTLLTDVTVRRATADLDETERVIGDLAIAPLNGVGSHL